MAANLEHRLLALNRSTLEYFANIHDIPFPPECSNTELVERIIKNAPQEVDRGFRPLIRLELDYAETKVFDRMKEFVQSEIGRSMDFVGHLKWVFGLILSAISLVIALGGVFGFIRLSELNDLQEKYDDLVRAQKQIIQSYQRHVVVNLIADLDELLKSVSVSFSDASDLQEIADADAALRGLLEVQRIIAEGAGDNDLRFLNFIRSVTEATLTFGSIGKASKGDIVQALNTCSQAWENIQIPENLEDPIYSAFARNVKAYRENTLGLVQLRRYVISDPPAVEALNKAEKYFTEALLLNESFARPYINLSNVIYYRFRLEEEMGKSIEVQLQILEGAESHLRSALARAELDKVKSGALNNFAHFRMTVASVIRSKDPVRAREALLEAKKFLERARNLKDRTPTIFITLAEVECELLAIDRTSVQQFNNIEKDDRLEEILDLVRTAIDQGFTGYTGLRKDTFLQKKPFYAHLGLLNNNYLPLLHEAAGITE